MDARLAESIVELEAGKGVFKELSDFE